MAKRRTHVLGDKGTIECLYYLVPLGLFLPLLLPSTRQEGPVGRDSGRGGGGGGGGGIASGRSDGGARKFVKRRHSTWLESGRQRKEMRYLRERRGR